MTPPRARHGGTPIPSGRYLRGRCPAQRRPAPRCAVVPSIHRRKKYLTTKFFRPVDRVSVFPCPLPARTDARNSGVLGYPPCPTRPLTDALSATDCCATVDSGISGLIDTGEAVGAPPMRESGSRHVRHPTGRHRVPCARSGGLKLFSKRVVRSIRRRWPRRRLGRPGFGCAP